MYVWKSAMLFCSWSEKRLLNDLSKKYSNAQTHVDGKEKKDEISDPFICLYSTFEALVTNDDEVTKTGNNYGRVGDEAGKDSSTDY